MEEGNPQDVGGGGTTNSPPPGAQFHGGGGISNSPPPQSEQNTTSNVSRLLAPPLFPPPSPSPPPLQYLPYPYTPRTPPFYTPLYSPPPPQLPLSQVELIGAIRAIGAALSSQPNLTDAVRTIGASIASLTHSDLTNAVRAIGANIGSPSTPPFPNFSQTDSTPITAVSTEATTITSLAAESTQNENEIETHRCTNFINTVLRLCGFTDAQSPNNCITPQQKLYLEHLEKKRTRLDKEEADLDKRNDEIATFQGSNLAWFVGILGAGSVFIGGTWKDSLIVFELSSFLAVSYVLGTSAATIVSFVNMQKLWWRRRDIWRRERRLLGMIENFSKKINDFRGVATEPSYDTITLEDAKIRLVELKDTFRSGLPYKRHYVFVLVQFLANATCFGVLMYWAYLVRTGKIGKIGLLLFGESEGEGSYSAT